MMVGIRKLIREMIMSEAYEHADDEIVTFDQIDLAYEFNKLNDLLFNGELQMVPLSWNNTKGKHGMVKYRINPNRTVQKIVGLFLSKYFKIPYRKFKDTLAHEMIHVKNIQDAMKTNAVRYKSDAHGYEFIKEMNRINGMGLGYNIDITSSGDFELSDHIKGRDVYFAIIVIKGQESGKFIAVMTPKAYQDRDEIKRIFEYSIRKGKNKSVTIYYFQSSDSSLLKYKVQRSFGSSITYHKLTDEQEQKLANSSYFMDKVEIGEGSDKIDIPTRKAEPIVNIPSKSSPIETPKVEPVSVKPEISDEMKEINKKVMAIFKSTTDKLAQEKLFDILKEKDEVKKQIKINSFNQTLGPKFGFII